MQISVLAVVMLSLIVGSLAYPYEREEDEAIYEGDPEGYVRLVPVRRFARAAHRQGRPAQGKLVYMPEGVEQREPHFNPQQRSDLDLVPAPSNKEPITAETGYGHSSQPYDYVDYGAYTGGYGAFGWYSDHPVQTHGGGYH